MSEGKTIFRLGPLQDLVNSSGSDYDEGSYLMQLVDDVKLLQHRWGRLVKVGLLRLLGGRFAGPRDRRRGGMDCWVHAQGGYEGSLDGRA